MQLGELFFSLGFKSTGQSEIKTFETGIEGAQQVVAALQDTMTELVFIVEQMAYKMGALTAKDLEQFRITRETNRLAKEQIPLKDKEQKQHEKKLSILGVVNKRMTEYWGKSNAQRILYGMLTGSVVAFTKKMSDYATQLDKINALTGVSADTMQRIGAMSASAGVDVKDMAGAIQMFQQESVNIKLGRGGNIGVWQFLGIDPHQDPLVIMDQLSKKLKALPTALGTTMAKDLGLSDDLIYFLKNAGDIKPPPDETILSDKEIKRLRDFNFYFNRVFDQAQRVLSKFGAAITPGVNLVLYGVDKITAMFGRWLDKLEKYQDSIKGFLPMIGAGLTALAAFISPTLFAFTMLLVALEDIDAYLNGRDSVTGRLIDYFKNMNEVVNDVIAAVATLTSMITFGKMDDILNRWVLKTSGKGGSAVADFEKQQLNKRMLGQNVYNNVTDHVTINVDGAKSPLDTVTQIEKNWNRLVNNTYYQLPQGGY